MLKRIKLSGPEKRWKKFKCILLNEKKPILKNYILCDSKNMTFWKRQNSGCNKKISGRC